MVGPRCSGPTRCGSWWLSSQTQEVQHKLRKPPGEVFAPHTIGAGRDSGRRWFVDCRLQLAGFKSGIPAYAYTHRMSKEGCWAYVKSSCTHRNSSLHSLIGIDARRCRTPARVNSSNSAMFPFELVQMSHECGMTLSEIFLICVSSIGTYAAGLLGLRARFLYGRLDQLPQVLEPAVDFGGCPQASHGRYSTRNSIPNIKGGVSMEVERAA
jgi:hypothetical protein